MAESFRMLADPTQNLTRDLSDWLPLSGWKLPKGSDPGESTTITLMRDGRNSICNGGGDEGICNGGGDEGSCSDSEEIDSSHLCPRPESAHSPDSDSVAVITLMNSHLTTQSLKLHANQLSSDKYPFSTQELVIAYKFVREKIQHQNSERQMLDMSFHERIQLGLCMRQMNHPERRHMSPFVVRDPALEPHVIFPRINFPETITAAPLANNSSPKSTDWFEKLGRSAQGQSLAQAPATSLTNNKFTRSNQFILASSEQTSFGLNYTPIEPSTGSPFIVQFEAVSMTGVLAHFISR